MKRTLRITTLASVCAAMTFGISSIVSAGGGHGHPAPPPPVLCGCVCPDGSIVITHAPDADSCPSVCATACDNTM